MSYLRSLWLAGVCVAFAHVVLAGEGPDKRTTDMTASNARSASEVKLVATSVDDAKLIRERQEAVDRQVRISLQHHVRQMMDSLSPQARAGYNALVNNVYLPHDFNDFVVEQLEQVDLPSPYDAVRDGDFADPKLERWSARKAEALKKFGISTRPDEPDKPLQYVVTDDGRWVMNCFACHGGSTYGVSFPGAPNTTYALESLTEQVRRIKLKHQIPLAHMDVGSIAMPLGTTVGTSNAVMFGVALMNYRDKDLNVYPIRVPAAMTHHDMDAPAWWHFQRKTHIYADGFAQKGHKGLMQFMLVRQNGPEKFRQWEDDFQNVYAFLSEVKPPKYPLAIDAERAQRGKQVFNDNCASCHGTYSQDQSDYPELNIALSDIGTDSVRHEALTPQHRVNYGESWFADYGQQDTIAEPEGYTAPPLDGIWSSAPYLHNGSVPTLRGVLFPEERPRVWRRIGESFNDRDVGFVYEGSDSLPDGFQHMSSYEKRRFFNTDMFGKSKQGHDYPSQISVSDREDLLEYLKTL